MNKYYKVPFYDYSKVNGSKRFIKIEDIIVKKGIFFSTEILTGHKFEVLLDLDLSSLCIKDSCIRKYGHQPVIFESDMTSENLATKNDIETYINNYDKSKWKQTYEDIKNKIKVKYKKKRVVQK